MIKRITDLEEMKRIIEVGDKLEVSDIYDTKSNLGIIVSDHPLSKYNVLFNDGYGDDYGDKTLSGLLDGYYETWDNVALIKEVPYKKLNITNFKDFEQSINYKFKIYVEPYEFDCYCGDVTLLNFNPSGQSVFLDKNDKLLIVATSDIKYMKALKESKVEK